MDEWSETLKAIGIAIVLLIALLSSMDVIQFVTELFHEPTSYSRARR